MGTLVHTGLGSSSLVAHVLHYPLPPRNSFVLGPAVIDTHTHTLLNLRLKIGRGRASLPAARPGFGARRLALGFKVGPEKKTLDTHSGLSLGQDS
jgi:hypothetical protein